MAKIKPLYPDILKLHENIQKLEKKRSKAKIEKFQQGASFPLPGTYKFDNPKFIAAAIEVIINLRQNYTTDSHYFSEQVEAAIAVAFDIRSAWSYKGLMLPDVPLVESSKQSVLILERWFRNAMTLVQVEINSNNKRNNGGQVAEPTKTNNKVNSRGKKYSPEIIKAMRKVYDKHYSTHKDAKAAWNNVAENFNIKSGKAAEMACRRAERKQNK